MEIALFLIGLTILGAAVQRWGADSRDGRDWTPQARDLSLPKRSPVPREVRNAERDVVTTPRPAREAHPSPAGAIAESPEACGAAA